MKNNLKGIIAMILAGGFILPLTGCSRNVGHYSVDNSKEITSNTQPVEDNTDCVEDETLSQKKVYSDEFFEELRCYVDEDIYLNLKNAKDNFEGLFKNNEDITTRMKKVGISLTDADSDFINDGVNNIYSLICNYIISYESGDYNSCIDIFKKLINCYKSGLSKDFLFKILVSNNLPIEYQSPIKYDEYGNMYDSSFNIKLKNNKLIRLIGLNDNLIINDIEYFDKYNNSYLISKWFQELPNSLICKYSVINNSSDNDGICYFCNETKTNEVCNKEYYQVIEERLLCSFYLCHRKGERNQMQYQHH